MPCENGPGFSAGTEAPCGPPVVHLVPWDAPLSRRTQAKV
jgi:hypothetical protein